MIQIKNKQVLSVRGLFLNESVDVLDLRNIHVSDKDAAESQSSESDRLHTMCEPEVTSLSL